MNTLTIKIPGTVWDDYLDPLATSMHAELGLDGLVYRHRRIGKGTQFVYSDVPLDVAEEVAVYLDNRGWTLLQNDPPEERGVHRRALKTASTIREQVAAAR